MGAEAEPVGLLGVVVGVLTKDANTDLVVGCDLESPEDLARGRKDDVATSLGLDELGDLSEVGLLEFVG